jgi:hypothetical protein
MIPCSARGCFVVDGTYLAVIRIKPLEKLGKDLHEYFIFNSWPYSPAFFLSLFSLSRW